MPHNDEKWLNGKIDHITFRKEQDILKDFETLGYEVRVNNASMLYLTNDNSIVIHINKLMRGYMIFDGSDYGGHFTTIQEHKLLNELFKVWQWL